MDNYGILSLAPALIAVILAFITREALFSIPVSYTHLTLPTIYSV